MVFFKTHFPLLSTSFCVRLFKEKNASYFTYLGYVYAQISYSVGSFVVF